MINKLKPKSEFGRNVLTLMTGTTIAQAIPLGISPILTRIYTPDDFGVFALFLAISAIFGSVATARYELAIMLPKKDEDAINIFALGFIIIVGLTLLLFLITVLFNNYFTMWLNNPEIGFWLYFVPVAVFFTGIFNILNYFNNRKKQYKDMANATIIKSTVTAIIQLIAGFLKAGAGGLISGRLISQVCANMKLFKNVVKNELLLSKISLAKIIVLAKRYKNFPKYSMLAGLLNSLSKNLKIILITLFFGLPIVGFYSLVQRTLGFPASIIGGAIGKVFFQQAAKEKLETGKATKSFNSTVKMLALIGLPIFGTLFFIVEDLFGFVFGQKWAIAGTYAQILIPLYYIRFVIGTVSVMNTVFLKNRVGLIFQTALVSSTILPLTISYLYDFEFTTFLYLLTGTSSFVYIIFGLYLNRLKNSTESGVVA